MIVCDYCKRVGINTQRIVLPRKTYKRCGFYAIEDPLIDFKEVDICQDCLSEICDFLKVFEENKPNLTDSI